MQHGAATLWVVLELPRLLIANVGVRQADDTHDLGDGRLELGMLQQVAHCLEGLEGLVKQGTVGVDDFPGRRDGSHVLVGHGDRAVDEVAPLVGQLEVHPADELLPGEVGVLVLRTCHSNEVAQRVWAKITQEVSDEDRRTARVGHLGTTHGEELAGNHLGGQVEGADLGRWGTAPVTPAIDAQQNAGPDHRVENDVVLAHEVVRQGLRVLPEILPRLRVAGEPGPLDGG